MLRRTSIKDVAKKTNVSPSTLRNWCDEGILEVERDFRGWRWFPNPEVTVRRVQDLLYGKVTDEEVKK